MNKFLSNKKIPVQERLIFALDFPSSEEAKKIVNDLGDAVWFYKLGLELLMSEGYFELVEWLSKKGKKVFADIKFNDVPQTVRSSVRQLSKYPGVSFVTVHSQDAALIAANKEKGHVKILAVTVLTSLDQGDVDDFGLNDIKVKDLVLSRAKRALKLGCDGVISSGIEAPDLREKLGEKFIIVSPGIRPVKNTDDQKRVVDVEEAFTNGADYIVVGRPIKEHHGFSSSKEAAVDIQRRIKSVFNC